MEHLKSQEGNMEVKRKTVNTVTKLKFWSNIVPHSADIKKGKFKLHNIDLTRPLTPGEEGCSNNSVSY